MGLRDIEATLPPGFRFNPSDEELVCHYLSKKIANQRPSKGTMVEVDLHTCEPWQLPDVAKLGANEWYFFSIRYRKYATGFRANRATASGYWKATGKDRMVCDPTTHAIVGMRKTLVFYFGRAPKGIKSGWIMHEFRLENPHMPPKEDWVLCRVFQKGKEETSTKLSLENEFGLSSPNCSSSLPPVIDQTMASFPEMIPNYDQDNNQSSNLLNLADHHHQQMNNRAINEINSRSGDECGFLFHMSLDEMGFEDDNVVTTIFS